MKNLCNILTHSVIFQNKTENEIKNILCSIKYIVKSYDEGDLIFGVQQPTEYIGIILSGSIEVQKNLSCGKIINILYKKNGDLFGEGSVFSKALTYPCNIYSKTQTKILLLNKQNMVQLLTKDPCLLSNFLSSFANRVLLLNLKTELLSYSSIQQKIAFSLIYLMDDYKRSNTVFLPYSKKTWSEHLNVSRPSLFRELKILCNKKLLCVENRKIAIINQKALIKILHN